MISPKRWSRSSRSSSTRSRRKTSRTDRDEHLARIFARTACKIRGRSLTSRVASYDPFRHIDVISSVSVTGVHSPVGIEVTTMAEQGFSGKRTAEIVDITYRQLDYWARTDLVKPSLAQATGGGSRRSTPTISLNSRSSRACSTPVSDLSRSARCSPTCGTSSVKMLPAPTS